MRGVDSEDLPSRDAPMPAGWPVAQGLDAFLRENGYAAAHYDAPRTPARVLGMRFSVPNPPRHRWAIMRHDLHHVATGYGTDLVGEFELAAWEHRRGVRPLGAYVAAIVTSAVASGLVLAPRRTWRAWRRAGRAPSLFHLDDDFDALLATSIGALRERLGIPALGLARHRRGLSGLAPRR